MHFSIGQMKMFAYYLDLVKDVLLVVRLIVSIGGLGAIMTFYDRFAPVVSVIVFFRG